MSRKVKNFKKETQTRADEVVFGIVRGSKHTPNIKTSFHETTSGLLLPNTDGILLCNTDGSPLDPTMIGLYTAGCGNISITSDDGSIMSVLHAGYVGVASEIITNFVKKLTEEQKVDLSTKTLNVYGGPMIDGFFELDREFYEDLFKVYFKSLGLHLDDYFKDNTVNNEKGSLNLRKIIKDIFGHYGMDITFSDIATNDPLNHWDDYRVYSTQINLLKKLYEKSNPGPKKLKDDEYIKWYTKNSTSLKEETLSPFELSIYKSENFGKIKNTRLLTTLDNIDLTKKSA